MNSRSRVTSIVRLHDAVGGGTVVQQLGHFFISSFMHPRWTFCDLCASEIAIQRVATRPRQLAHLSGTS